MNASGTDVYRIAIDATTATLTARGRAYRALTLVVALGILSILIAAIVMRSFAPLVLLIAIVAAVGAFFWLDARRLVRWRQSLLEPWQRRELDFSALGAAVTAIPGLPANTVGAMLTSLPQATDLVAEQRLSSDERRVLALAMAARDRRQLRAQLIKA